MTTRILILEDSAAQSSLLTTVLQKTQLRPQIVYANTVCNAEQQLLSGCFDVALTAPGLSDSGKLESVRRLRATARDLPIVVLANSEDGRLAVDTLSAGAQEFLLTSQIEPEFLERIIRCSTERMKQDREIREQRVQLQQKLESYRHLLCHVSHDFRTPLTVIREYASLMQDGVVGELNSEQRNFQQIIADRADDLSNMVDDMLDSSRLEADAIDISRRPARIDEIIRMVRTAIGRKSLLSDVKVTWSDTTEIPEVFCDPQKASRVLTTLTTKAIRSCSEPGHVHISISVDSARSEVTVSVSDNGPGLDASELNMLLTRFQQPGLSTQRCDQEFGLDLTIARELADLNWGHITVESKLGVGSTFSFTLPVNDHVTIVSRNLSRLTRLNTVPSIACVRVALADCDDEWDADQIDAFWMYTLQRHDLVLKQRDHVWILLLPTQRTHVGSMIERIEFERLRVNQNRFHGALPPLEFAIIGVFDIGDVDDVIRAVCEPDCAPHGSLCNSWPDSPLKPVESMFPA